MFPEKDEPGKPGSAEVKCKVTSGNRKIGFCIHDIKDFGPIIGSYLFICRAGEPVEIYDRFCGGIAGAGMDGVRDKERVRQRLSALLCSSRTTK